MDNVLVSLPLKEIKHHLAALPTDQLIVVCDQNIARRYAPWLQALRSLPGKRIILWSAAAGEKNKTLPHYTRCMQQLLTQGIHRQAHLVAIGGGGLSDFAGFVAATLLRGIAWSVVPTTLLAQVDGAIGGKTALNCAAGKNLIGSFHPPQSIFLCPEWLQSLEPQQLHSGLGEVVKYGLLQQTIFDSICRQEKLAGIIHRCAKFKQALTAQDPRDQGERRYLNLGHTFGHAYEALTGEPHGLCVLWGIEYLDRHFLRHKLQANYQKLLQKLQLKPHFLPVDPAQLAVYLSRDKKRSDENSLQLVLLKDIGRPYLKTFPLGELIP